MFTTYLQQIISGKMLQFLLVGKKEISVINLN